ncbi:MAG: T9SS type A sorting domain-containing protein [Bacteroidota bacterium]
MKKLFLQIILGLLLNLALLTEASGQNNHFVVADGHLRITGDVNLVLNKTNLTNNASVEATAGTVVCNGDPALPFTQIGGSSASRLHNLAINRPANVHLGNNIFVSGLLDLRRGLLVLNDFDADLGTTGTTQFTSQTYVTTPGMGTLRREVANGETFTYPVGRRSPTPMTLQNDGTTDVFGVRVQEEVLTGGNAGSPYTTEVVDRTWLITEDTDGGSDLTLTAQWNAGEELPGFDRDNAYLAQYLDGWDLDVPMAATGNNPYQIFRTGITTMGPFAVASGTVLPVELVSFTGEARDKTNLLTWTTANEEDFSHFELERSADGRGPWSVLAALPSAVEVQPDLQASGVYECIDESPIPTAYYRLKMVDLDGTFSYSEVVYLENFSGGNAGAMKVYPNPSNGHFTVEFTEVLLPAGGKGELHLVDMHGREVWARQILPDQTILPIALSSPRAGVYLLTLLTADGRALTQRFVIH